MTDVKAATTDQWEPARTKTVSWYDPSISATAGDSLPGREFLQAISTASCRGRRWPS